MLNFGDLKGIGSDKKGQIEQVLTDLLTCPKDGAAQLISGWAWFDQLAKANRLTTFSHTHRTETYKEKMIEDLVRELGNELYHTKEALRNRIRARGSAYVWMPSYHHRDPETGELFLGRRIKDLRDNSYVLIEQIKELNLKHLPQYKNALWRLICEDVAEWQIDLPFDSIAQLVLLAAVFQRGRKDNVNAWPGADEAPLVVVGPGALNYLRDKRISNVFVRAARLYLEENNNEISLVIDQSNLRQLISSEHYNTLLNLGFKPEPCLVNEDFAAKHLMAQHKI